MPQKAADVRIDVLPELGLHSILLLLLQKFAPSSFELSPKLLPLLG